MTVGWWERRPATVQATRYEDGALDAFLHDLHELGATWERAEHGEVHVHDWDTFRWEPVRPGDWVVRDERGVTRPMDDATLRQNYDPR